MQVVSPLADARRHVGLTQRQLGARSGVSRETICLIERGQMPRLRTLLALADALAVEPAALIQSTKSEGLGEQSEAFAKDRRGATGNAEVYSP